MVSASNPSARSQQTSETITEAEYRRIVDLSPEAIAIHTMGTLVYINREGAKLMGANSPKELLGLSVMQFVHPDYREIVKKRMQYVYDKNQPTDTIEEKFIRLDGKVIDVEVVSMPFVYKKRPSVQLMIRDISTRKELDQRLLFLDTLSNALFTSFDENITLQQIAKLIVPFLADYCRIAILDERNQIKEIAINHTDSSKVQLVSDLYDSYKDRPENTHGVPKILQTGKPELITHVDKRVIDSVENNPKLQKIVIELGLKSYIGVPLIARGKIIGAISISSVKPGRFYTENDLLFIQEVGRRLAIALDNARLYANAQKAIMLRDDFISIASHELKTPVTSLKAFTQVLQNRSRKADDLKTVEHLAKMNAQIDKLNLLIQDLLDVTKIEGGKLQFHESKFYFDDLMSEVVEEIQRTTDKHKISIKGTANITITADRERIGQVITNFLTNAIKYSPHTNKIYVKAARRKNEVIFNVQDFGVGIPQDKQPHVFERFYRVTGEKKETYPGLGLGLYISSQIIIRQGGKIGVKSEVGNGSTFYFSLPIRADKKTYQQINTLAEEEMQHE